MVVRPYEDPILKRFRAALDRMYGERIERVVLFVSQARGDARADSDYDMAVFIKTRCPLDAHSAIATMRTMRQAGASLQIRDHLRTQGFKISHQGVTDILVRTGSVHAVGGAP